jgi:DNA-binding response OmpR family regulator
MTETTHPALRLAVLDDDPAILHVVEDIMHEMGWNVISCRDVDSLDQALNDTKPDAVLIDVYLPGDESGWDVLQRLKDDDRTSKIPIIVSSGDRYTLQNHLPLIEEQAAAVLVKPFEPDDLYRCVDHAVGGTHTDVGRGQSDQIVG